MFETNRYDSVYYKHKSFGTYIHINTYYYQINHNNQVRVILSTRYKDKLAYFAQLFSDQKSELQFLVTQKSTVAVTKMKHTLDAISVKVDKVIGFLETRSSKEEDAIFIVQQ